MSDENTLVPVEQKQVEFYGDDITAVRVEDGTIYIPVRPLCDLLGLDWSGQRQRIVRDAVLSQEAKGVGVMTTPSDSGVGGGRQEMLALPLDYISGFLFGVNAARVKEEIRDRLIRYQRECYKVLAEAFVEGRLTADPSFDELLRADSPAAQAYQMARALMEMARQQVILESRLAAHDSQLSGHDSRLAAHEDRLEEIEATLGDPGHHITPEQASSISQAVKSIAMALGKKSGRNEYGAVYGEFYRKFGIPSYRELPARRFDDAMRFLTGWYQEVTGEGLPF